MIRAVIADARPEYTEALRGQLEKLCPHISLSGVAHSTESAWQLLREVQPELVFLDEGMIDGNDDGIWSPDDRDFEVILLSEQPSFGPDALRMDASAYLFKPVQPEELVNAVHQAQHYLELLRNYQENRELLLKVMRHEFPQDMVGIPTMEGIEFLHLEEIIRCEGLSGFTRIVMEQQEEFLSSYNIGTFRKLLEPYGFFCPHKSHLINLRHLRKFKVEGTILMRDGSCVPVARRRRLEFLERIKHL